MGQVLLGVGFDWRYRKSFSLEDLRVMDEMERLSASSNKLRKFFMFLMLISPVLTAVFWIMVGMGNQVLARNLPVDVDPQTPTYLLLLCFLVSMIPTGVVMYAFYQLSKLFGNYGGGAMFSRENTMIIRTLGKTIIAWEIANFLGSAFMGLLLTLHRGPGQRLLVLGLDNADILALAAGFSVLATAWIMDEALKINDQHRLVV